MTALLLAALAVAQEPPAASNRQFRQIQLVDGRTMIAEVLATTPQGMRVRAQEGELTLSYELLLDMQPSDQAKFDAQDPWVVLVGVAPDRKDQVTSLLDAIPSLVVWTADGVVGQPSGPLGLADAEQAALRTCGPDPKCLKGALGQGATWKLILSVQTRGDGVAIASQVSTGEAALEVVLPRGDDAALWPALHAALGLDPPSGPPPSRVAVKGQKPPKPERPGGSEGGGGSAPAALAFAPVPGLPALANGDGGRFALSMAVALPATAGWVAAVGTHAESVPEHAALGLVGFYAITVLANEVIAVRH